MGRLTAKPQAGFKIRPMSDDEYRKMGMTPPSERVGAQKGIKTRPPTRDECERWGLKWLPEYERQ